MHNPSGEGVRALSTQAHAKASKFAEHAVTAAETAISTPTVTTKGVDDHETRVKEGTAKRNIIRKKTADKDSGNYNSLHKKQGKCFATLWREMLRFVRVVGSNDGVVLFQNRFSQNRWPWERSMERGHGSIVRRGNTDRC